MMKNISLTLIFAIGFLQISKAQNFPLTGAAQHVNSEMGFMENDGQIANAKGSVLPDVLFQSVGTGPQIFVTTSGLTFVFHHRDSKTAKQDDENLKQSEGWSKIEMNLAGASIRKENIETSNELPGYSNFYYSHCPNGILNVKSFHKIIIRNVYPGIDWVLNADNTNGMSHDFIVHANGNADDIKIIYKGIVGKPVVDENGRMVLKSAYGNIFEGQLNVYEEKSGKNIPAGFKIARNVVSYKFLNKGVQKQEDIIIDPPLQWTMPQASTNFDYGYAIAAAKDGSGDVLLTGESDGTDFPVLNAYQGNLYGFEDMVVQRLNSSGTRLWSTYYGGTDYEVGKGIACDNSGNCYVTGTTGSTDMPVLNSLQPNFGGGTYDAVIAKFNSTGVRQWASWRGSVQNDYGQAITSDASGTIYVTGYTNSPNFPMLNATQPIKNTSYDLFIMKLNSSQVVQWSTFYGGNDEDKGRGITLDAAGVNVYLTGSTLSGNFPGTTGFFQQSSGSANFAEDAFILKLDTGGLALFASYCGGSDVDFGQGITVDNNNNIFITGYTISSDFPTTDPGGNAYYDNTQGSAGTHDAFIVECNNAGTTRIWSTYFGGTAPDLGFAIASDPFVGIYICGNTASTDFPVHQSLDNVYYQSTQGDGGNFNDMFIAWFGANDSLEWSTYYGDASSNEAYGISVDANSNIFVTGVDNNDIGVLKFNPGFPLSANEISNSFSVNNIYPNPANETIFLDVNSGNEGEFTVQLMNSEGQLVLTKKETMEVGQQTFSFDISGLANGVYLLKTSSEKGNWTGKFVKE